MNPALYALAFPAALMVACVCGISYSLGFRYGKRRTIERICKNGGVDVKRLISVSEARDCIQNIIGWALRLRRVHQDLAIGGDTVTIPAEWLKQCGVELTEGDGSPAPAPETEQETKAVSSVADAPTAKPSTTVEHHHPIVRIRSKPPWDW